MAEVELLLPALPAHVRTARVVCVAAARRAGLSDELVDELRLAVGEACARAVGLHAQYGLEERVEVRLVDDVLGLTVTVRDHGPAAGPAVDDVTGGLLDDGDTHDDFVDPDVALALLLGLVDETEVTSDDTSGTTVLLRWPLPRRVAPGSGATQLARG